MLTKTKKNYYNKKSGGQPATALNQTPARKPAEDGRAGLTCT